MSKRSSSVALFLAGATAFALAGCREETVDAQAFPDLQSCLDSAGAGSLFSAEDCRKGFAEAAALNAETAPRYDSLEVCEAQYGAGNCASEAEATTGGSGSIFMPLLAGYLLGNMLGGGRGLGAQPLHRTADGRFTNPAGTASYANNTGKGQIGTAAFAKAPSTIGKPPMTKATAVQSGGFGASSTRATGSARSLGG